MSFLSESSPAVRGRALHAFHNRPRGSSAEIEAERIANALGLDPDTGTEDFSICLQLQDKSFSRILDRDAIKLLADLSKAWGAPRELILVEALKRFSLTKPDPSAFDNEV